MWITRLAKTGSCPHSNIPRSGGCTQMWISGVLTASICPLGPSMRLGSEELQRCKLRTVWITPVDNFARVAPCRVQSRSEAPAGDALSVFRGANALALRVFERRRVLAAAREAKRVAKARQQCGGTRSVVRVRQQRRAREVSRLAEAKPAAPWRQHGGRWRRPAQPPPGPARRLAKAPAAGHAGHRR